VISRRIFLAGITLVTACGEAAVSEPAKNGRLLARPAAAPSGELVRGKPQRLGFGGRRDGTYYVPAKAPNPAPLVLALHGAGGNAARTIEYLQPYADAHGFILLVPDSRGSSWDLVQAGLGPDVEFVDRALAHVFARVAVDRKHIAANGFSDGASYALTLGITNGDLFTHVIAFSPGFLSVKEQNGRPLVFVSHGTKDEVLPIERCGRRVAAQLRNGNYPVTYREFEGPHTVPESIAEEAFAGFVGG
jgi:phospholipase/carboxylesterase